MQRFVRCAMALVLALGVAASASAAPKPFRGEAKLATAVTAPTEQSVDGVSWKCEADKCVGQSDNYSTLDSFIKECRKVSAVLGPLSSYSSRGRELTGNSISPCNRGAKGS
jgi:hypothetical protein